MRKQTWETAHRYWLAGYKLEYPNSGEIWTIPEDRKLAKLFAAERKRRPCEPTWKLAQAVGHKLGRSTGAVMTRLAILAAVARHCRLRKRP